MKILIVGVDPFGLKIWVLNLRKHGYWTTSVNTSGEALNKKQVDLEMVEKSCAF